MPPKVSFAVQNNPEDESMLLTIDNDIFYEFIKVGAGDAQPVPLWELEKGAVYEMLISSSNGLWRYHTGDTVRVYEVSPVKIKVAGRTRCFINAFGEELMEENAERAISAVCSQTGASVVNYTAAPVFAEGNRKGRHQWLVEWGKRPADTLRFSTLLDEELRRLNSDYDAKRTGTIFLILRKLWIYRRVCSTAGCIPWVTENSEGSVKSRVFQTTARSRMRY